MRNVPRILPLLGVAVGGVLAINALSGARALPDLLSGARAFAEDVAKPDRPAKKAKAGEAVKSGETGEGTPADTGDAQDATTKAALPTPTVKPVAVCAPTAAELAKEAGLSPAELQVLQSLGVRRGQLDQREQQLDVQLALMAAAEAKLDAKVRALTGLKTDIKGLLVQADSHEDEEINRLVKVFEAMKPKDAAPRMVLLEDSVRLPIAAKMKERVLSAILAQMPPPEAKRLTESLARRFTAAQKLAADATAQAQAPMSAAAAAPALAAAAAAAPAKAAPAKAAPRKTAQAAKRPALKKAPASARAANVPAPAPPAAPAAPVAPPAPPAAAAPAAKAG
ncbi:MotE family protein [Phenylobacterium sp.]|jgi:flagellar motility protein MotE (MotC chaperone)|uniref:MotE family protein n=1 Tax=Phenylobacterium sp. TaxID=1871053 RepID=UPI002F41EDC3